MPMLGGWKRVFTITALFYLYYTLFFGLVDLLNYLVIIHPAFTGIDSEAQRAVTLVFAAVLTSHHLRKQSLANEESASRDSMVAVVAALFLPIYILILVVCISILFGLGVGAPMTILRDWAGIETEQLLIYTMRTLFDLTLVYGAMYFTLISKKTN